MSVAIDFLEKTLLPFRLVDMLNKMVKVRLMETDDATWRIRHRIIQDYFADQWIKPEQKEPNTKKV